MAIFTVFTYFSFVHSWNNWIWNAGRSKAWWTSIHWSSCKYVLDIPNPKRKLLIGIWVAWMEIVSTSIFDTVHLIFKKYVSSDILDIAFCSNHYHTFGKTHFLQKYNLQHNLGKLPVLSWTISLSIPFWRLGCQKRWLCWPYQKEKDCTKRIFGYDVHQPGI